MQTPPHLIATLSHLFIVVESRPIPPPDLKKIPAIIYSFKQRLSKDWVITPNQWPH